MPAVVSMTLVSRGAEAFRKRDMQRAGRAGMKLIGQLHHRKFKPKKFEPNAQQRYKLQFRNRRYRQAKRAKRENGQHVRAIGEDIPFVWSGATRELALAGRSIEVRAPSAERHYVTVKINAPQLNRLPWLRREMEIINQNEIAELKRAGVKRYERQLSRVGRKVARRTKK